jgi:hypothetical protein
MTSPSDAHAAFEQRHAQMRQNAGDWLLKNRNALQLCQSVLIDKWYATNDELHEKDHHNDELCCFLSEIEDAVDLLGSVVADLRGQRFWPEPEQTLKPATDTEVTQ